MQNLWAAPPDGGPLVFSFGVRRYTTRQPQNRCGFAVIQAAAL